MDNQPGQPSDSSANSSANNPQPGNSTGGTAASQQMRSRRTRWLALASAGFVVAGIAYATWWALENRHYESTDDAYVGGNVVQITPQIAGTVVAIGADDTNFVKAGQTLIRLDQADAQVALEQAEAQLGKAVREVRNLMAVDAQLGAGVALQRADLDKANEDLARRERLASSGAIAREEVQHARDAKRRAEAALVQAQQELAANRARVDRTTVEDHPDVKNAAARVHDAYLTYSRTALPAPVSGYVAKRAVQLGQRVTPGAPLMAVVPLDQVWVDANFKEGQIAAMRPGQPAKITADIYGSKMEFHGHVVGFGAGTGAAFSLLPAQNATGNWIKIVQRVPVRVSLDPRELAEHPLQVGLSMQVEVDTQDRSGERLPQAAVNAPSYSTDVFRSVEAQADERIHTVIAANEAARNDTPRAAGQSGLAGDKSPRASRLARFDAGPAQPQ